MRSYQETLTWLYRLEAAKGMDFKLERVALALQRLGDPQRRFGSFHIAGTNGKGSVAAMLHAMLVAGGYRVGLYVSPHLVRFTERIRIGQREIGEDEVVELAEEIQREVTSRGIELTFFEFVTVMAFLSFARAGVEIGVIEVGLGGRLDATNVVDPLVAAITTIGHDHAEYLGDSLRLVAAEKGGIVKPARPVVLGKLPPEASLVIREIAAARGAPLLEAGEDYRMTEGTRPSFAGLGWTLPDLEISLRGRFQRENAGTALACLATAAKQGVCLTEAAIRQGLAALRWPGRLEIVGSAPLTILDGAHNPEGIANLVNELPRVVGDCRLHALFAVMRDKDWQTMAAALAPLCASAVVTEVLPPRGLPAAEAAEVFRRYCATDVIQDPVRAWDAVRARGGDRDCIIVAGSLFLIGAVYPHCGGPLSASATEFRL